MTELSDKLFDGLKADAERMSAEVSIDDLCKRIDACAAGVAALQADLALWQGRAAWLAAKIELPPLEFTSEDWLRKAAAHWRDITAANKQLREEVAALKKWLDSNTTFYDVDADFDVEGRNVPALAQVSARIWYHATDDIDSYPFSAAIDAARSKP